MQKSRFLPQTGKRSLWIDAVTEATVAHTVNIKDQLVVAFNLKTTKCVECCMAGKSCLIVSWQTLPIFDVSSHRTRLVARLMLSSPAKLWCS